MLKAIGRFIIALNGNVKKTEIAAGAAWGVILGLIPVGNFFWVVIFLISFLFRNNFGSKILTMLILKLLSPLIVYFIDGIGWQILHIDYFQEFFTSLYNMPFVPFTKFNNTLVMGGLVIGAALWLPVFFIFLPVISLYRKYIAAKIRESKLIKSMANSPFLKLIGRLFFQDL